MKFIWEEIWNDSDVNWHATYRAKVIGGWIVKNELYSDYIENEDAWRHQNVDMVFIPDPEHKWEVK